MLLAAPPPVVGQLVNAGEVSTLTGARIAFWAIAALVVGGAIFTITRRNPVAAVMSLVATFFGLAAAYALLSAHFLAALQVLVYAGAIMVLFIFVVMVLNREEVHAYAMRGVITKGLGTLGALYLVTKMGRYFLDVEAVRPEAPPASFGTVAEVGTILFTDYLFAFEAVSVLLLIAVVAAVVVARAPKHLEPGHGAHAPEGDPGHAHDAHAEAHH